MKFRYLGVNKDGLRVSGTISGENEIDAMRKIKKELEIPAVLNLTKESNFKIYKKINTYLYEHSAERANKSELKKERMKELKASKLKAKKNKALTPRVKRVKSKNKKKSGPIRDLLNMDITELKKKNIEIDDEMYEEMFHVFNLMAKDKKEEIKQEENIETENNQKDDIIKRETPKLKSDDTYSSRKDKAAEKEIDWSVFEGQEVSSEVRKNMKIKIKNKEILMFTKRLQIMLSSGMTLAKSLLILSKSTNKNLNKVVSKVLVDIQGGNSFSQALSKFPNQFDYSYVSLVSIGESSGSLDNALVDIIAAKEKMDKINKKIKSASIYPTIIGIILALVVVLGSLFFIPTFEEMFIEQEFELPALTKAVFGIANNIPIIVAVFVVLFLLISLLKKRNRHFAMVYKKRKDKILLNFPKLKKIVSNLYMYKFSYNVSIMLKNGIRLKDALVLAEKTIDNLYIKSEIRNSIQLMMQGNSLSESLSNQPHFDEVLTNIVLTGEESGQLNFSLREVSKFYSDELDKSLDTISEIIQPVSILAIGLVVVPVVIAIYLPILEMTSGGLM